MAESEEEGSVQSLAFALAVVYAAGLMTTNFFINSFGMNDLGLIKPKAIFTGAISMGSIALIGAGPIFLFGFATGHYERTHPHRKRILALWSLLSIAVLLILFTASFFATDFFTASLTTRSSYRVPFLISVELFASSVASWAFAIQSIRLFREMRLVMSFPGISIRVGRLALHLTLLLASIGFSLYSFATHFYGLIPQVLGGGRPEEVHLVVRDEDIGMLRGLGVKMDLDQKNMTEPVLLLYESDEMVGLLVDAPPSDDRSLTLDQVFSWHYSKRSVKLDKKEITAIVSTLGE